MIDAKPRCKAVADIEKNRLVITMAGHVDEKSITKLCSEVRYCVTELKQRFEVIIDLTQCSFIHLAGLTIYKKIIDCLILNKVGEMIRIIDDDNISTRQIKRLSEKVNCYKPVYAKSNKEAIDTFKYVFKRKEIRFQIHKLKIEYESRGKTGIGVIADISSTGCAVESHNIILAPRTKPVIILTFDNHETIQSKFRLNSTVVRSDEKMFAVKFSNIDHELKEQLYKRLAYEVTRSVYLP